MQNPLVCSIQGTENERQGEWNFMRGLRGERGQFTQSLVGHKEFAVKFYMCYGNPLQDFKQGSNLIWYMPWKDHSAYSLWMNCRIADVTAERDQLEGYMLKSNQEIMVLETKVVALGSRQSWDMYLELQFMTIRTEWKDPSTVKWG